MTEQEAMQWVGRMRVAVQKVRSNMDEGDLADAAAVLTPWFYGDKNILKAIAMVEERGSVTGQEFHNLMYVAHRPRTTDSWPPGS